MREACALQSAESDPWVIPSREVIVATFERMFPKAAKNASRFMGRWNDVDEQKVMMMKLAPISENTDDTREVIWRISNSRVVQAIFERYIYIYMRTWLGLPKQSPEYGRVYTTVKSRKYCEI